MKRRTAAAFGRRVCMLGSDAARVIIYSAAEGCGGRSAHMAMHASRGDRVTGGD